MNPTWLDVILVVFIVAGAIRGFMRGLIREGMAFGGLAIGLVLATEWYAEVADAFKPFVGGGRLIEGMAYLLVVLTVLAVATLLTVVIMKAMRYFPVGWIDGIGGLVFGAAQGAVLAVVIMVLMLKYPTIGIDGAVKDSSLARSLLDGVPIVLDSLPPEFSAVSEFFDSSVKSR